MSIIKNSKSFPYLELVIIIVLPILDKTVMIIHIYYVLILNILYLIAKKFCTSVDIVGFYSDGDDLTSHLF